MDNRVKLGSNWYYLAEGTKITRQFYVEWTDNLRTTGQQQRADRSRISSWLMNDFSRGVGLKRIKDYSSNSLELKRLWDSTSETRWQGQVTPSIEAQAATKTGSQKIVSRMVHHKGSYFTLGYNTYFRDLDCLKWNSSTSNWDKAADVGADNNVGIFDGQGANTHIADATHFDLVSTGGKLYAIMQTAIPGLGAGDCPTIGESDDGDSTWTLTDFESTLATWLPLFMLYYNNVMYIAIQSSQDTRVYTHDLTTTWALKATVRSAGEATGLEGFEDTSGTADPFLATRDTVWLIDTSATAPISYVDLRENASTGNGVQLKVWNDYLMIPYDNAGVIRYESNGDSTLVGLDLDDGLTAESLGDVTATLSTINWFFVAVGGSSATTYAKIWAYDGTGWHFIYRHATANQEIRFIGVNAGTLHIVYTTAATTTSEKYLDNVLLNPVNATGMKWNDDCYIELPEYDGGMPEFGMGVYKVFGDADDLVDTDEYIEVHYGTDGASATTTDLGDINATTSYLTFGSGVGITATRIQPHFVLTRSANTKAPKLKSMILNYLIAPGSSHIRTLYTFTINLLKSATELVPLETVITNLNTIAASKTLTTLEYARPASVNVLCLDMSSSEEVQQTLNELQRGEREGDITCYFITM